MTKALTEEEGDKIVPRARRVQAQLEAREDEALEGLAALGFRVTFHEVPRQVKADPLLGVEGHYRPGNCYAVMYGADGRRKHVADSSAVGALVQARSWWDWQKRLKPDAPNRFVPSIGNEPTPEATVRHELAGDTAQTEARRERTERRVIALEGTPHLVDPHGDPISDISRASQFA